MSAEQHLCIKVVLQYNSGAMVAHFKQVNVLLRLFFTWILCIYVILDKGCHILCVFGLTIVVCSHIVGVPSFSDQVA